MVRRSFGQDATKHGTYNASTVYPLEIVNCGESDGPDLFGFCWKSTRKSAFRTVFSWHRRKSSSLCSLTEINESYPLSHMILHAPPSRLAASGPNGPDLEKKAALRRPLLV